MRVDTAKITIEIIVASIRSYENFVDIALVVK